MKEVKPLSKIYLTSDLHLCHNKPFVYEARGFDSIEEMNEEYVKRWNDTVNEEDDVYVLGDLVLNDPEVGIEYLKKLKGKIHIVLGNHDTPRKQQMYAELPNVVEITWAIMLRYKKYHFFLTHFPCLTANGEKESLKEMTLNLHGHTHQLEDFTGDNCCMYHVGVDSHYGYPVCIDDIITDMKGNYENYLNQKRKVEN